MTQRRLAIDVVVHGRFHAFHLARALIARGHDVRVLTNYPGWAVERFGIPRGRVRSFVPHGIATRVLDRALGQRGITLGQPTLHRLFGEWAARTVRPDCDLVYAFSGVAEETLLRYRSTPKPRVWLVRGSSHIQTQLDLLSEEERRAGVPLDKPSAWSIAREEREYALAERIVTLSTFCRDSFAERARLKPKAMLLRSAVDASRFKAEPKVVESRLSRIERGDRLRLLTVGALSYRKGAIDLIAVADALKERMDFRFVGDLPVETSGLQKRCVGLIDLVRRIPEFELGQHYAWGDIFLFPTIEDGFPAVVAQAQASGLPVITTPNGSGPDLISPGVDGWIVPIRDPKAIMEVLNSCDRDRAMLAKIVAASAVPRKARDWSAMAEDLEAAYEAQDKLAASLS